MTDDRRAQHVTPRPVRSTFVAPDPPRAAIVRYEPSPVQAHEVMPAMPAQTVQSVTTNAVDRAKGFSIATIPLAAMAGTVAALGAVTLAGVPLLSGAMFLVLFGVFAAVWLAAWLWYQFVSPDGVTLFQVLLHYRLLRHEQRARLERIQREMDK